MKRDEKGNPIMYYDRECNPMTLDEWVKKFEDMEYRVIGQMHIGDVHISTVWLGTDMSIFDETGPRDIFETMVFGGDYDSECWRYDTEELAKQGHIEAVRLVYEGCSVAAFTVAFQKFLDGKK